MFFNRVFFFLITAVLLSPLSARALKLTPSNFELKPNGSGSSFVFNIGNEQNQIIAVQISIYNREIGENNEELNTDASSLFEIYPSQIILQPEAEKKLRIRWIGDKKITSERAFRLHVTQLPVNFSKAKEDASVKVLHRVVGALYVTPASAKSDLVIETATKQNQQLVMTIKNNGTKHSLLNEHEIVVKGEKEVLLNPIEFGKIPTQNVLAHSKLIITVPWPHQAGQELESIKIK